MSSWRESTSKIILLDNGSYEIKHSKPSLKKNYKFHNAKFLDKSTGNSISSSTPFFIHDIRSHYKKLPENIAKSLDIVAQDKINETLKSITDNHQYKKIATKLHFISQIPIWVTKYTTVQSMNEYLKDNSKLDIQEKSYTVKDLLPKLEKWVKESLDLLREYSNDIKVQKFDLDRLVEDAIKTREKLRYEKRDIKQERLDTVFKQYHEAIELIYMQLGIYQRSILYLYGEDFTEVVNTIHSIYEDIESEFRGRHEFGEKDKYDDHYNVRQYIQDII